MKPLGIACGILAALLAGCLGPAETPASTSEIPPEIAKLLPALDAKRPPEPPMPACAERVGTLTVGGLEGIKIEATPRTPPSSVEDAKRGLAAAHAYLEACAGGDLNLTTKDPVKVYLRSSAHGDERRMPPWEAYASKDGSAGGEIHADAGGRDGFPDAGWSFEADQAKTFAHEYAHVWHNALGCGGRYPPVPRWFSEGIADYVGYHQGFAQGSIPRDAARTFLWRTAVFTGEAATPLREMTGWGGNVGFFAIEALVNLPGKSPTSLRELCEGMAAEGRPDAFDAAFARTFGRTVRDFDDDFFARYGTPKPEISPAG